MYCCIYLKFGSFEHFQSFKIPKQRRSSQESVVRTLPQQKALLPGFVDTWNVKLPRAKIQKLCKKNNGKKPVYCQTYKRIAGRAKITLTGRGRIDICKKLQM
jgi:hypothetical protein